eukprot:TRINITY_DN7075_c0_g1_i1.p1 TRINITY_DN7075_c0_g1~~TRINITY_DN7075_c0_g1_i1.p1  ORF type:complete len:884 (-),score=152.60 TRINITY_DN7075_c0_g1_i1:96-2747(-)
MEPPSQGTHSQVAPIPVSPAAFLLEIRRRRADLADAPRIPQGTTSSLTSFSSAPVPLMMPGRPQSPSDESNVIRWLQRIDERLGSFGEHMSRVETLVSSNINTIGTDSATQDAVQKLTADLQRQRAAYYQMLATSEAVVSKLMRENSDLKDRINFLEQDESSQQNFPNKRRKLQPTVESELMEDTTADLGHPLPQFVDNDAMDVSESSPAVAPQATFATPPTPHINYPTGYDPRKRRFSISSESYSPELLSQVKTKVIPKSDECRDRLRATIMGNTLFRHLTPEELDEVISAMWEVNIKAGETIIREGDDGDNMYVVERGELDVLYSNEIVATLGAGRSFGEQALMYNSRRNATIRAQTDVSLWAVDRGTFRRILMQESLRRRALYESFLAKVPLFEKLLPYERAKVADALEPVHFEEGAVIVKQGTTAGDLDHFYIIEKGTVDCTKQDPNDETSKPLIAMRLGRGGYFGELALLTNKPRQATVTAVGGPVKCLAISKKHFSEVMGPVKSFLRGRMHLYASYAELREKSSVEAGSLSASGDSVASPAAPGTPINNNHSQDALLLSAGVSASLGLDIESMVQKEREFNDVLRKLVEVYRSSLLDRASELKVPLSEIDVLFPQMPELLAASSAIISKFPIESTAAPSTAAFLEQLEPVVGHFELYVKSFYVSIHLRKKRRTVPSFAQWVELCDNQSQSDLNQLLKAPLRRLSEYSQFSLGILQSGLGPDIKDVAKRIQQTCHALEQLRLNAEKVYTIQQNIVGEVDIATDPDRVFVAEGEILKLDSGENLVAYLFSDLLVLARAVSVGGGKIKATHFCSIDLATVRALQPKGDFAGRLIYVKSNEEDSEVLDFRVSQSQWLQRLFDTVALVLEKRNAQINTAMLN